MCWKTLLLLRVLIQFSQHEVCRGTIYSAANELPDVAFDFIVVGGGTAGSVVANRLTENPDYNVLVIEAGVSNRGALNSMVPGFATKLENSIYDWNFTTVPQKGLNGRSVALPRGHVLGGSSSINDMFYTRGSSDDYNRFASVTGDPGWSWDQMLHYILKNEIWTSPADHHNTTGQFDPALHNSDGMTFVSLNGFPQEVQGRVIQTTKDLPDEFGFNLDMNSGRPLGVGWFQNTVGNGMRSSAATSYLATEFTDRRNLHILLQTRVTRLVQTSGGNHSKPIFKSVEVGQSATGPKITVSASKEVIMAAGSIGTPHILMHSGIGDAKELKAIGIKSIVDIPDIGKNLTDHPLFFASWSTTSSQQNTNATEDFIQWNTTHTGPLTSNGISQIAWSRIPEDSPILKKFDDPSAGPHSPHLELALGGGGPMFGVGMVLVTPSSRGSVSLSSYNPFDAPLIDPALLSSQFDILAAREVVESTRRFMAAPAWSDYIISPAGPFAGATTNALLDEYIRNTTVPASHPVGTAAMSARNASYGVVDPDLLVKGVSGVRIVDASVMPFVICGHTQAPVYAISERAADLIKNAWK